MHATSTLTTEDRILDAAEACLQRMGLRRASMGDVAAEAGLSRGSVYRYFPDRESLVDAVIERVAERFVAASIPAVDRRRTLAGQVGEAAAFINAHRSAPPSRTDALLATLMTARIHRMVDRWVEFWLPRLAEAQARGELRPGLDHRQAAEWIVRLMLSFAIMPSATVDLADADAIRTFVRNHLVRGLAA